MTPLEQSIYVIGFNAWLKEQGYDNIYIHPTASRGLWEAYDRHLEALKAQHRKPPKEG